MPSDAARRIDALLGVCLRLARTAPSGRIVIAQLARTIEPEWISRPWGDELAGELEAARAREPEPLKARAVERAKSKRLNLACPARRRRGSIAFQRGAFAEQRQPDPPAALRQNPRRDKTVAAVIARAAQDGNRTRRPASADRVGNRTPGILHQHGPGHTACDRQSVSLAHLLWCQQGAICPTGG